MKTDVNGSAPALLNLNIMRPEGTRILRLHCSKIINLLSKGESGPQLSKQVDVTAAVIKTELRRHYGIVGEGRTVKEVIGFLRAHLPLPDEIFGLMLRNPEVVTGVSMSCKGKKGEVRNRESVAISQIVSNLF